MLQMEVDESAPAETKAPEKQKKQITMPPGKWRIGKRSSQGNKGLFLRFATKGGYSYIVASILIFYFVHFIRYIMSAFS